MTEIQRKTREFVSHSIRLRFSHLPPPAPETKEELAFKVAEGLVYLSFLPTVLFEEFNSDESEMKTEILSFEMLVKTVAAESYVAITEYFNQPDGFDPKFPVSAKSRLLEN